MEQIVSFPLRGFVTRCQNEIKVRSVGKKIADSSIDLNTSNEILFENKLDNSLNLENSLKLINEIIQPSLFGNSDNNDQLGYKLKSLKHQSLIVTALFEKFTQLNGSNIKILWVKNHSTLVELVQETIPAIYHPFINTNELKNNPATFLVDVTCFIDGDLSLKVIENNSFLISLLYRMSFIRAISNRLNLSDKMSFNISLSLLNDKLYLNQKEWTPEMENSILNSSLRVRLADFLDNYGTSLLNLDHDQSLSYCLRLIESSYQKLPQNLYFNSLFELENLNLNEKDSKLRDTIRTCLDNCDRQVVLLIKQMDIKLPYNRQEFRKSMNYGDIKIRRDMCFQIIKNFNHKTELLNIDSIVSRLNQTAKYNINQPRLVVGRESRAFGNQAYLFANSKLIQINAQVIEQAKRLEYLSSIGNLRQLLRDQIGEKLNLTHEMTNILIQLELKFEIFLHELVPSLGRLISLVYNQSKLSSFTQYSGAFQNLRETLEIFARKSATEVEKQRKVFIENETSNKINEILNLIDKTSPQNDQKLNFFSNVLNALTLFSGKSGQIENSILSIENSIHLLYSSKTNSFRAAYCVLLQRPSYTGSDRFKLNELESKPEQEESLQKLVRTGGDHLHMSPSYEWIVDATDLIEAVPLFIYERTIITDGKPMTVFEVDQEGLEQTIRQIAEYWAQNIEKTIESEHLALARSILVKLNPELESLSKRILEIQPINKDISNLLALESLIHYKTISKNDLSIKIAKLAQLLDKIYNESASIECEKLIEKAWSNQDFITRIEAFQRVLINRNEISLSLIEKSTNLEMSKETERLSLRAFERQRSLPAFHLLTTEAPGLIEGFITVILEEEMAMRNVIKAYNLENQVKQLSVNIQKNLSQIAEKVIEEFGYEPMVSQLISNGMTKEQANLKVMSDNIPIQEQVSSLAILLNMYYFESSSLNNDDKMSNISLAFFSDLDQNILEIVENYWSSQINLNINLVKKEVFKQIFERNKSEPDFIDGLNKCSSNEFNGSESFEMISYEELKKFLTTDLIYSKEVNVSILWLIRTKSFEYVSSKYPDLYLKERAKSFIREHTALIQTTCRRHVISKNGLHDQLSNPKFGYSSGVTFESTLSSLSPNSSHLSSCTSAVPTGLRKRYHLIYGPSRVNLGKDERKSVENWSQFIGVSDPLAAKHAQDVYELINYSPVVRNVREAENLKVSENQWTALVRSCRNVQAFFVERLGVGDIEDLSYQFNQRGGINLGSLKEGEGYNSGPTAGYCIPKDLLFKLFVGTHQDSRKLLQIGVPRFLHKHLLSLMTEVYSRKNEFQTIGEWEYWAAEQFLKKECLLNWFKNDVDSKVSLEISDYLHKYINLSGSQIVFHLTKLIQVIGNTGIPSPLLNTGRDLHSVLWSNWSDQKITLGGEQVNRSTVFTMTREIPESAKRSKLLNPRAGIVEEDSLRIQMFGVYKGDDDEPPPPDVRYSWTMRAFQIFSGHYQAVADSLDIEGQIIARLSWVGFKPDSKDPKDIEASNYLLKKFNQQNISSYQLNDFFERLKKAFPCHRTVGDITITAVPGVDSEDLLGFSAETLTLLGDEADKARQILETQGKMSIDQMKANAILRKNFPEEWAPLNQLSSTEQQRIKNLVGESIHPLVLRLRGPGSNFFTDLQGQDVVVFSITHPEILKLNPAHLRDLMLVGRPNSALCALDFVAQGRHRCWFERDVMLWYAAARGLTIDGKLSLDWSKRNHFGRQSVYKAFGTGNDQYSPALGTDIRSEVVRQERRAIEIWNSASNLVKIFKSFDSTNSTESIKLIDEAVNEYEKVLKNHLSNNVLANEALHYQQYSQRLLMAKRFKPRDRIIQESIQTLLTTDPNQLVHKFSTIDWLSIGGIFLINGSTEQNQNEILSVIRKANLMIELFLEFKKNSINNFCEALVDKQDEKEKNLISKLIVSQLATTQMSLGERKGEMFSVKASEDCQIRAVARRAQLSIQSVMQKTISFRKKGFEKVVEKNELNFVSIIENVRKLILDLSSTPDNEAYSLEFVNETFGLVAKYTTIGLEITIKKVFDTFNLNEKGNIELKNKMLSSVNSLFKNGSIDLKVLDLFCGTYEDHGFIAKLLEFSCTMLNNENSISLSSLTEEILSACELLYFMLALEKTSQFLTKRFTDENSSVEVWRKLSEFFAKTIDDHFYEYNPWILDSKRGSAFVHFYDNLGIIKNEFYSLLYEVSWRHHRVLYKYLNNIILNHSDLMIKVTKESDRNLLIGLVELGDQIDGSKDRVLVTALGNHGVGEDINLETNKNYEALWRSYNQLREISFMRNDGFEFPVVFSEYGPTLSDGLNVNQKVNLAILSPVGRTHYSRAIMESSHLNENVFITRTGFLSNDGLVKLKFSTSNNLISRDKTFLFIEDAHFFLSKSQYYSSLKYQYAMSDQEASNRVDLDEKLGRFTCKGIRIAAKFKEPILIGCCIAHHHHPLEIGLTIAGYPSTDKSPFLFDLTYNKSIYPLMYSNVAGLKNEDVLLPPQIDWLQEETSDILDKEVKINGKSLLEAEKVVIESIKQRLRPFALDYGIIIAKGSAESGARNLSRFDIKNLTFEKSKEKELLNEDVLHEACKFIYEVSKGQNVTIQKAIVSTSISWMSQYAVKKFIQRQIIEHSVSVNIEKYPKDFIYGTLRVILSSAVPDLNDLSNLSNWQASHLLSLSSLQTATNVGRQGTLEMLAPEMIHSKYRAKFIDQLIETGKKAMSFTSNFGPKYWNESIYLDGSGESYKSGVNSEKNKILPFKIRRPEVPEKDACNVPYWWPRYLMLDIIPEPIFVDEEGKEVSGAHIIDIKINETRDGDDQTCFTVCDKNGQVIDAKIIDFKFWLLEPNVGIGLWPNYWKRELVRCQENSNKNNIDFNQVGISDRIVLSNFLKAGREFLNVKFKTNDLGKKDQISLVEISSYNPSLKVSSNISESLYFATIITAKKYGLISIGVNQISLWLVETLRHIISDKYKDLSEFTFKIIDYALELLKSIKKEDVKYSILKSNISNVKVDLNEEDVVNWLKNEVFSNRISQIVLDSILSNSLAPALEISPRSLSLKLLSSSKTFAIISEKTTLITHQIYPFIVGRGNCSINVIGVHTSWILPNSNLANRAILYDEKRNIFVEGDLETPLVLDYGFLVELYKTNEIENHLKLSNEYEKACLNIINPALLSKQKADNKLWIRNNKSKDFNIPNYLHFTRESIQDDNSFFRQLEPFLINSKNGIIVQPSSNTTESSYVYWFSSSEKLSKILETSRDIFNYVADTDVLISEFRGNLVYEGGPIVFRFNVSAGTHVTVAAYVGVPGIKIVNLKGTSLATGGYCERLDKVLNNLYEESTNKKVKFNSSTWNSLLNTARSVAKLVELPIVGIDILLESNENSVNAVILEVNARPGTLIFGEELIFNESGTEIIQSLMAPAVNEDFWNYILDYSPLSSVKNNQLPKTLLDWKHLFSSEQVSKVYKNIFNVEKYYQYNTVKNCFLDLLGKRYGINDPSLIIDRINCLIKTVDDAINSGFDLNKNVSIIFSNGRDRYFGGHTDFLGLGGPTINATTENEIIAIIQKSSESTIYVSNSNTEYKSAEFSMNDIAKLSNSLKIGEALFDPNEWTSYLKGTLAYMLSDEFSGINKMKSKLFDNDNWVGFKVHFNSSGRLSLQSRVGYSSSSSLTTAFVLGLNKLFDIQLSLVELSQTDYGEYYLGKTIGCADKTTILNAINRELIAISSIPERYIQSVPLPSRIVVIMANSNIPRLNSTHAKQYLNKLGYSDKKIDSITSWAQSIMRRFGSFVFVHSVNYLIQSLLDENKCNIAGLSNEEAHLVLKSLGANQEQPKQMSGNKSLFNSSGKCLLRELCSRGELEKILGCENRHKRYNLIFRLLKLLPENEKVTIGGIEEVIHPRKATLYGISEIERCYEYMNLMNKLNTNINNNNFDSKIINSLLDLVRSAHNGDRAVQDYRNDLKVTSWATDLKNQVSDEILDSWISNPLEEIFDKPGGFERSLPEFDEWAESLNNAFDGQAALRVSAAGLGGTVCIHSLNSIAPDVITWLKNKGLSLRVICPGPSHLVI